MFNQSQNPLNLTLIFLLECFGLVSLFYLGIYLNSVILAITITALAIFLWGWFRSDADQNKVIFRVKGWVRLLIEFSFFTSAVLVWVYVQNYSTALVFGGFVVTHYLFSLDRIKKLMQAR